MERIYIDLPNHWAVSGETIWAERLHHDLYWVASIPFYAYGVNFEDVVRVRFEAPDQTPCAIAVVQRSGNETHRILLLTEVFPTTLVQVLKELSIEWEQYNSTLIALTIPPRANRKKLYAVLDRLEAQGVIEYETGEAHSPERPGLYDEENP